MRGYVLRRLLHSVYVLFGVATAAFYVIHLVPGDPVRTMLGFRATPHEVALDRHELGLDSSIYSQYLQFLHHTVTGNFGNSILLAAPVRTLIGSSVLPSVYLITYSVVVTVVLSVPLAILSAVRRNRAVDHIIRLTTTTVFAMPSFWVGLVLAYIFGLRLGWLPVSGYGSGPGSILVSLTLPAITIGLYLSPMVIRTLRSSLIESLASDYIEAARARGIPRWRIVLIHAMRNSVLPAITVLGANVGYLISGTVIIEEVFQLPGLGTLLVNAILTRDYPVVQALTVLFGAAVVLINLATDMVYPLVDRRINLAAA